MKNIIKVIYCTKSGIIFENKTFGEEVIFGDIINYFNRTNKNKLYTIKNNYNYFGKILKNNDKIKNLVFFQKGKVYEIEIRIEINEKQILNDELDPIITKMFKPKLYSFGLYIYTPKDGKISLDEFTPDKISEFKLDQINSGSAYCNSPKFFFISGGGVYSKDPVNSFWIINNDNLNVERKIIPFGKREHSMIYLPNDKVFLVGGNDKKCCFYDIKNKKFIIWANLNSEHIKPALIDFQNYLYSIHEINKEKNFFERTDINSKYPKWDKIIPKFKRNVKLYNKKIFWVSKSTENSVVFGAGEKKRTAEVFVYDLIKNEISKLKENFDISELDNKKFDKISKYYNVSFPKFYTGERNILVFDKKFTKISKIFFENEQDIVKIKMKDYDEEEKNEISPILIKTKVIKDYTIKNNNNNNNNFNLENIGKEYDDEEIEDDKNFISKNNLQIGENGAFFQNNKDNNKYLLRGNKNINVGHLMIKKEDEQGKKYENTDLNTSIIKHEFDTLDKNANTERSLLRQIGNDTQDNKFKTQNNDSIRRNMKLPAISQNNVEFKSISPNKDNFNYKIEYNEGNNTKKVDVDNKMENKINIAQNNINNNNNNELFNRKNK